MKRLIALLLLSSLLSCNSSSVERVTVTPASATMTTGATQTLQAVVTGTGVFNPAVTWTASAGRIDSSGALIAPSVTVPTVVTVRAVSLQDPSQSGTANITVTPTPTVSSVTALAQIPSIRSSEVTILQASVIGEFSPAQAVTWSIQSGGGTLSPNGGNPEYVYTAPSVSDITTAVVRATSVQDASKFALVSITITPRPTVSSVTVSADKTTLPSGEIADLSMSIVGTYGATQAATWSIVAGGGALSETRSGINVLTAPTVSSPTTVTVRATSIDDPSKFGTINITVQPPPANSSVTDITISAVSTVVSGAQEAFYAYVTGLNDPSKGVNWSIVSGGGTLSRQNGSGIVYTAPIVPSATQVVLRATSAQNPAISQTATLTINPAP